MQIILTLSPTQQRLIALVLAAIPAAILGTTLTTFVESQIDRHQQALLLTRRIAHERAIVAQSPSWKDKLSELRQSSVWRGLFAPRLHSQSGALAEIVRSKGGKDVVSSVRRMETLSATEIDEQVQFSATTEQLAKTLRSLRGFKPLFVVRACTVESTQTTDQTGSPNILRVRLTVAEFERPL